MLWGGSYRGAHARGRPQGANLDLTGCTRAGCPIYELRTAATEAGYGGICVAPGGRLAARFVAEREPAGVVAIACNKELAEGRDAVEKMEWAGGMPASAIVPLLRDGCVDTEVDVAAARAVIVNYAGHDAP